MERSKITYKTLIARMKEKYAPPSLTVVTFKVEKGFIDSSVQSFAIFSIITYNNDETDLNQAASYSENNWVW